jgi:hypothetical protein
LKDLNIELERIGHTSLKVNWQQQGNFTNYAISRYIINVAVNGQSFREIFESDNHLSSSTYQQFIFKCEKFCFLFSISYFYLKLTWSQQILSLICPSH